MDIRFTFNSRILDTIKAWFSNRKGINRSRGNSISIGNKSEVLRSRNISKNTEVTANIQEQKTSLTGGKSTMNNSLLAGVVIDLLSGLIKVATPEIRSLLQEAVTNLDAKAKSTGNNVDSVLATLVSSLFQLTP